MMYKVLKLKNTYYLSVFLLMASMYHLSFTWRLPSSFYLFFSVFTTMLLFIHGKKMLIKSKSDIYIWIGVFYLYLSLISPLFITGFGLYSLTFIVTFGIISLSRCAKYELLQFISRITSILLAISLVAWIIYLLGVPLPYTLDVDYDDKYHTYIDYYFFLIIDRQNSIIPRFSSFFIEPGQLSSICALLLLANLQINRNKFDIIVLFISLILSFSLVGWVVFFIGVLLFSLVVKKHRTIKILMLLISLFTLYKLADKGGDESILNTYIFDRLQYSESTIISGYNRTNDEFDQKFHQYINSSQVLFGIHNELTEGSNWTIGNAGYKVFIVINGLIGFILLLVFFLRYMRLYNSKRCQIYFLCYIILGCVRSFFYNPYWLYVFIITIPLLFIKDKDEKERISCSSRNW